jgi:hypothetical protein
MTEQSQSSSEECYAVYSQKQFDCIQTSNENNDSNSSKFPYIYYETYDNKLVQVTELFHNESDRSNFNDAIYLGKIK